MPVDQVPDALAAGGRRATATSTDPGEPFHQWARRTSAEELRSTLHGAVEAVAP